MAADDGTDIRGRMTTTPDASTLFTFCSGKGEVDRYQHLFLRLYATNGHYIGFQTKPPNVLKFLDLEFF